MNQPEPAADGCQDQPHIEYMDGDLPYGRHLTQPIMIVIEQDDAEIVVSEPRFHMHAGGRTETGAKQAFRRVLSGYLDVLARREGTLGEMPKAHLAYLRSIIA